MEPTSDSCWLSRSPDSTRTPISQFTGPVSASAAARLAPSGRLALGTRLEGARKHVRTIDLETGAVTAVAAFDDPVRIGVLEFSPGGSAVTISLANFQGDENTTLHEIDLTPAQSHRARVPHTARLDLSRGFRRNESCDRVRQRYDNIRRLYRTAPVSTGTPLPDERSDSGIKLSTDGRHLLTPASAATRAKRSSRQTTQHRLQGATPLVITAISVWRTLRFSRMEVSRVHQCGARLGFSALTSSTAARSRRRIR